MSFEKLARAPAMTLAEKSLVPISLSSALIVDDHPLFCEALSLTLKSVLNVREIDTTDRLEGALERLGRGPAPDAILLDLTLPDVEGLDGLIRIKKAAPDTPVIIVSSLSEPRIIASAIRAGAAGFVPKHSQREVFREAFSEIWQGRTYLPGDYIPGDEGDEIGSDEDEALRRLSDLTPQQLKILQAVCAGKLNKQIAYDLNIAETTVKAHITAILRKLGVQSRTQAAMMAQNARFSSILLDRTGFD